MKTRTILSIFIALILTTALACSQTKAPDFTLKTNDGTAIQLSKYKDKVILVNFLATWCSPCREEIPGFIEVYGKYRQKGFEIIGIALDRRGWYEVLPFVQKLKIPYPIVLPNEAVVEAYGPIEYIPTTFFVDKTGNIVHRHQGYMSKRDLERILAKLL